MFDKETCSHDINIATKQMMFKGLTILKSDFISTINIPTFRSTIFNFLCLLLF